MNSLQLVRSDVRVIFAIVLFVVLLAVLPLVLSPQEVRHAFSEEGPFERLSILGWLFAALVIVARIRPLGPRAWAFVMLCLLFAAREADWHKAFTADSLLKTNYYKHAVAPMTEKLMAGAFAIAAIALLLYVGFVVARFLLRDAGWRSRSGIWLLIGSGLVALGKVLDRAPAVLNEDYGVILSPLVAIYAGAFEEGLEMIHPLILSWSVWISQTERRYLS